MSYLTVIPLADAKAYLKVEDTATDDEITRMIKSSLAYLEKRTNILVYSPQCYISIAGGLHTGI